jgi:hypothetical protein
MDYDDVVDMMICYFIIFVSTGAIDWFFLSVQDSGRLRMSMASMDLLGLWIESGSGLFMV